jgi:serine/threonine protein kinase
VNCPSCQGEVLDIDVKCEHCGAALGATGAHRMVGQVVLSQYELVDVLGQGGMSVVFKGRHHMTGQEVALKILPPELAAHSQVKSRFLEEAKALAALDHPNIVHLYNFGQENGSFVLAMQFVQGRTWERVILENKRLDWKLSCRIAIDVLKALEYAHGRGVVHRDMKPSNVLVRASDGAATVMDFGIAKMTTSTKLTATGQTMGTVRYMSPEQVRGQEVDLRTDLYSLGATIYESLTGETPFDGSTHFEIMTKHLSDVARPPSSHGVELPRAVEDAVMRSLAKKREDRFESARDMRKVLEAALREGDVGLVETQRLQRDLIGESKSTKRDKAPAGSLGMAQTARAATANDLAEQLEGGTAARPSIARVARKGMPAWGWGLVGVLVLGAGVATATLILKEEGTKRYQPRTKLPGVTLTAGAQHGAVYIETTGTVPPDEVAALYTRIFEELHAFVPPMPEAGSSPDKDSAGKGRAKDPAKELAEAHAARVAAWDKAQLEVLQEIALVPRASLCEERITRVAKLPCTHKDLFTTSLRGSRRVLLVADDRETLPQTLRAALAQSVCDYQFLWLPEGGADRFDQICEVVHQFIRPAK